jgi:hypothetical protein
MKVSKCPLNIESCISCRYAEGTGLRCTYSIDKSSVDNPASEEIDKEMNEILAIIENDFVNGTLEKIEAYFKRKHAGEIVGLLPETRKLVENDWWNGYERAIDETKQNILKWGKGE